MPDASIAGSTPAKLPTRAELEATVRSRLGGLVMRRIIGGKTLTSCLDYRLYRAHGLVGDTFGVLSAIGLVPPVLSGFIDTPAAAGEHLSDLGGISFLSPLQVPVAVLALAFGLCAFVLRVVATNKKLAERGPLMNACAREFEELEGALERALNEPAPLKAIAKGALFEKSDEIAQRYRARDAYPWAIGPENVDTEIAQRLDTLISRYSSRWEVAS